MDEFDASRKTVPAGQGQPSIGGAPPGVGPTSIGTTTPAAINVPDPFSVSQQRLAQDFSNTGVQKILLTVPIRKPPRECFFRVHPGEAYRTETKVIELKERQEIGPELYQVHPQLWPSLSTEITFTPRLFVTGITRQGTPFIWALRLAGLDGKLDSWSTSAQDVMEIAKVRWVRMVPNMELGAYVPFVATGDLPDPIWPEQSFDELLGIAFRDRRIDSIDHPVLKRLRGVA